MAEIAYSPRGEQVVARVELPGTDVVPLVARYSYVVSKDEQRETARPKAHVAQLYRSIVSQIALLYLRDLFDADPALQIVDVNAHVRHQSGYWSPRVSLPDQRHRRACGVRQPQLA